MLTMTVPAGRALRLLTAALIVLGAAYDDCRHQRVQQCPKIRVACPR